MQKTVDSLESLFIWQGLAERGPIMAFEQSATSAFVRPRQDYQQAKRAEKVQTDHFYGTKRVTRSSSSGSEFKERRKDEMNNNINENVALQANNRSNEVANVSAIPRRNFMKTPDGENTNKQTYRKESMEKNSPKPRRKLPAAPASSTMKPRTAGNELISKRSTPDNSRRSTPERQFDKSRMTPERMGQFEKSAYGTDNGPKVRESGKSCSDVSRKTPEINRKSLDQRLATEHIKTQEVVSRKNSDSSEKNIKMRKPVEGSLTLPNKKQQESNDSSKGKGILGSIKYNSLPRRHPSKNHSKFYLDIEGEEYMPKNNDDVKLQSEQNDKSPLGYGLEKLSLLAKGGKTFTNGMKSGSHEGPSLEIGSQELKQTHVALYKFFPRHKDEVLLEEGDPVNVSKIGDDLWFEGTNLVSGKSGIFPSRYVADILAGSSSCKFRFFILYFTLIW